MVYENGGMGMQISLNRLPQGIPATVIKVDCSCELTSRLKDFGLVPGTQVLTCYRSPDRGVTALEFCGTVVALRTRDLKGVRVIWG